MLVVQQADSEEIMHKVWLFLKGAERAAASEPI